jgi:hypothetical protein
LGGGVAPAPIGGAWGASSIRNSRVQEKRAVSRPSVPGVAELRPLFPGGPGGAKLLVFTTHRPCKMCKKKTVVVHVTRW